MRMKSILIHCRQFAARHKLLAVLGAMQLVILLALLVNLFRPAFSYTCAAADMTSMQEGVLADTTLSDGARAITPGQENTFSKQMGDDRRVAWLQAPAIAMPAGRYSCSVNFISSLGQTDTAGTCTFLSDDASIISPDVLLKGNTGRATGSVWLNSGSQSVSPTIYAQDPSLTIIGITVRENYFWRVVKLFEALLLFALLDLLLLALTPKTKLSLGAPQRLILLGLAGVVLIASLPAFSSFVSYGFDLQFHLSRISGIAAGLQAGEFPVRIYPDALNGYGYASPVFYGDLLLYIPALLYLAGYPLYAAYQFYLIMLNVLTAGITFICLHKMFRSLSLSMLGAALYTTAAYRIFNMYYRPALGECSAQTFLPLVVYGFWALYADSASEKQRKAAWLPLMLGFTGVIQTHVITTEITALAAVVLCLALARRTFQKSRLIPLLKGAGATVLLNLWFLVPFFAYMRGDYACTATDSVFNMDTHALPFAKMFSLWSEDMSDIRIGAALVAGLLLFAGCMVYWAPHGNGASKARKLGLAGCVGGLAAMFLSSSLCHWGGIENYIGQTAAHYLCAIQFPFRYLVITTVLFSVVAVCAVAIVRRQLGRSFAIGCACALIGISCVSAWLDTGQYIRGLYGKVEIAEGSELASGETLSGLEYLPTAFAADLHDPAVQENLGIIIDMTTKQPLGYTITAQNPTGGDASIELPLTYYPGYRITRNSGGDCAVTMTDDGTVAVTLAGGYSGTFTLRFVEPRLWRAAELVSLGFGLLLIAQAVLRRKKAAKRPLTV